MRQVASKIDVVHGAGLVHGDLQPRKIVRMRNEFVLLNFDASVLSGEPAVEAGASAFCPPEVARILYIVPSDDSETKVRVNSRSLDEKGGLRSKVLRLPGRKQLEKRMQGAMSCMDLLALVKEEPQVKGSALNQQEGKRRGSLARVPDSYLLNMSGSGFGAKGKFSFAQATASVNSSVNLKGGTVVTEHVMASIDSNCYPIMDFSYDVWSFGVMLWIAVMNTDLHADVSKSTGDIDSTESMQKLIDWEGLPASLEDKVLRKYGEKSGSTESTRRLAWRALDLMKWCVVSHARVLHLFYITNVSSFCAILSSSN